MRILIVDDEQEIRLGIGQLLKASTLADRLEIVGMAKDGAEALAIAGSRHVDLIITDIRMPGMSGLELIRHVRAANTMIQFVILSGYDDFGYARDAMRYGAMDYLLKPVDEQELIGIVGRLIEHTEKKNEPLLHLSEEEFRVAGQEKDWKTIVLCHTDDLPQQRVLELGGESLLQWILVKALLETARELGNIYFLSGDSATLFRYSFGLIASSKEELKNKIDAFAQRVHRFCSDSVKVSVSFGISELEQRDAYLQDEQHYAMAFIRANHALFSRVLRGSGIYYADELGKWKQHCISERLEAALDMKDSQRIMNEIDVLIDRCAQEVSIGPFILSLERLLFLVHHRWQVELATSESSSMLEMKKMSEKLLWSSSTESLRISLMKWLQGVLARLDPGKQEGQVLDRAKKYIQANLQHPVNLAELSEETHVSPQYLSKLFREKSGETFIEYMTRLRMEEAKRLLMESGVKVYEVASQVGYSQWKHFSRVFRKYTGYSPSEYKNGIIVSPYDFERKK